MMSRESFEQIGIVVATFQRVEHLLLRILAERWTPENGRFFNSWICTGHFSDILKKVTDLTRNEISEEDHGRIFVEPWGTIPQLHQIRNDWVHSYYRFDQSSSAPRVIKRIRSVRWREYEDAAAAQLAKEARCRKLKKKLNRAADTNAVIGEQTKPPEEMNPKRWKLNPAMYQVQIHLPANDEFHRFTGLAARAIQDLEKLLKTDVDPVGRYFDDADDSENRNATTAPNE